MGEDHSFGEPSGARGRDHQRISTEAGDCTVTTRFTLRSDNRCRAHGFEKLQLGRGGEALINGKDCVTGVPDALEVLNKVGARGKINGNEATSHGSNHPTDDAPVGRGL
jgi:hypothetical protein